jgi:hypothetical protein
MSFLSLQFGIEGVAMGVAIVSYLGVLVSMFYCFHNSPVVSIQFIRVLILPFFIGTLAMGSIVLMQCIWHDMSFIDHIMGLVLFFGIYIAVSSYRKTVRDTIKIFLRELGLYGKSQGMNSI